MAPNTKRPFPVTLLAALVLFLTVLNAIRFGAALWNWQVLTDFAPQPGPIYIALTGLFWFLVGLTVYAGLWLVKRWGWGAAVAFSLCYPVYFWIDRLVVQQTQLQANASFSAAVTLVWVVFAAFTLIGSKTHFLRGIHER